MTFELYIGIDYSGAKTPKSRNPALQVYTAELNAEPRKLASPSSTRTSTRNWTRQEIADWLRDLTAQDVRYIAGIDHGFSFPVSYLHRYGLESWDRFLVDFAEHWPTDSVEVDSIRKRYGDKLPRTGGNTDLRLTEQWSSSAKSVFQFDVQGSVAKSTHAGLPWLLRLRTVFPDRIHFWPFDAWTVPEGKAVIAEVFPSVFRNRYPRAGRSCDQQDAYAVARWLSESSARGFLEHYFHPPLTHEEQQIARLEGWILGIT